MGKPTCLSIGVQSQHAVGGCPWQWLNCKLVVSTQYKSRAGSTQQNSNSFIGNMFSQTADRRNVFVNDDGDDEKGESSLTDKLI